MGSQLPAVSLWDWQELSKLFPGWWLSTFSKCVNNTKLGECLTLWKAGLLDRGTGQKKWPARISVKSNKGSNTTSRATTQSYMLRSAVSRELLWGKTWGAWKTKSWTGVSNNDQVHVEGCRYNSSLPFGTCEAASCPLLGSSAPQLT